ncbi:hypothetical protein GPECTOR_192g310 [Gonium pectorale]|uniref:Uncharacterized protein n=1 Tax=Gonium pectorale TaxID=33097 RepID=A0A150FX13_GONPE|nr:hypothetical protein GPECTOR_192g310 [Gonium pectorale]|eukprot:KXZ42164.1 hypothetical protein GPECTOR_192g310 [Gonium pectorale]
MPGGADDDNPVLKPILPLLAQPERKHAPVREGDLEVLEAHRQARIAEHHAWVKDMTTKFKLQRAAMKALPERLRQLAMVPDHTPFPMDRKYLFDTPPEAYRDGGSDGSSGERGEGAGTGKPAAAAGREGKLAPPRATGRAG